MRYDRAMTKNIINMEIFEVLDKVAKANRVSDVLWAKVSGIGESPRISELRAKAKMQKDGDKKGAKDVGRALTIHKCKILMDALKEICGRVKVAEDIMKIINQVKSETDRLILFALAHSEEENAKSLKVLMAMSDIDKK